MKLSNAILPVALGLLTLPVHAGFIDYTNGAIDPSSGLALRTAHYWNNTNLDQLTLQGRDCEILNLVLNVSSGSVQVKMGEEANNSYTTSSQALLNYPDQIFASSGTFVYSLYTPVSYSAWNWKTFKLVGQATGMAFAYCYSNSGYTNYVGLRSILDAEQHKSCQYNCGGF